MCLLVGVLLAEVLLAGVLPLVVLLAVEEEMVLAESLWRRRRFHRNRRCRRKRRSCHFPALRLRSGTFGAFSLLLAGLGASASLPLVLADALFCCYRKRNLSVPIQPMTK